LAHERLAIIDLVTGTQPLLSEDSASGVVVNGEIYNYKELRNNLEKKGHRFSSRSDSEVILHGYEEEGISFFSKLDGMFAFALWDGRKNSLVLARDVFGKKPLVYTYGPQGIAFASVITALKAWDTARFEIAPEALVDYLRFRYVTEEHSIYRGITKVPPGHAVVVDSDHRLTTIGFATFPEPGEFDGSYLEAQKELRRLLRAAVQKRLQSDVPLGLLLSAGIDSSILASEVAALGAKPKTYTLGFKGFPDETETAKLTARRLHLDHRVAVMDLDLESGFQEAVRCYDEPFADSSAIATYCICRFAKQEVTVAICGDGGDENFAGYAHFRLWLQSLNVRSGAFRDLKNRILWTFSGLLPRTQKRTWREDLRPWQMNRTEPNAWLRWLQLREVFSEEQSLELLGSEPARSKPMEGFTCLEAEDYDWKHYLRSDLLVKVDRASMINGLELRSPFLDDELVRFTRRLPMKWKVTEDGRGKRILRDAFANALPKGIWEKPKTGFQVPVKKWLKSALMQEKITQLENSQKNIWTYLDRAKGKQVLARFRQGAGNEQQVWSLLVLSEWMESEKNLYES
jgi:asparagine synthase (glutamine-hydrolysing)